MAAPHDNNSGTDPEDKSVEGPDLDRMAKRIAEGIGGVRAAIDKVAPEERAYEVELAMRLGALERAQRILGRAPLDEAVAQIRAMAQDAEGQGMIDLLGVLDA